MDLRLPEQQRGLERPPLDRRQLGQDVAGGSAEEVGQPRERERRLGLRGPGGQDPVPAGGGGLDAGQPQRGLADPGLARQHGGARKLLGGVEQPDDRSELFVSTDKVPVRYGHVAQGAPIDERPPERASRNTSPAVYHWLTSGDQDTTGTASSGLLATSTAQGVRWPRVVVEITCDVRTAQGTRPYHTG